MKKKNKFTWENLLKKEIMDIIGKGDIDFEQKCSKIMNLAYNLKTHKENNAILEEITPQIANTYVPFKKIVSEFNKCETHPISEDETQREFRRILISAISQVMNYEEITKLITKKIEEVVNKKESKIKSKIEVMVEESIKNYYDNIKDKTNV